MAPAETVLGFDFGRRRIGVAVGQQITRTATALETITVGARELDFELITRLVESWRPDRFVVGLPVTADGGEHALHGAIRKFARRLEGTYHKPVSFIDERLSSYAAADEQQAVKRVGLDAVAAQLIIETWFETLA